MRAIPLGPAAMLFSGGILAQTGTPHTDHGRSSVTNVAVGANAASTAPQSNPKRL